MEFDMTKFSLTDLSNRSGEVAEAAFRGPVEITKRGKRKFVLMTVEDFDRLAGATRQRAYRSEDLSEEDREFFLTGLEAVAREGRLDDD
jgi:prevent-host-death family protein